MALLRGPGPPAGLRGASASTSCEALYASGEHVPPFHSYPHSGSVVEGDGCSTGSSGIAGVAFGFYPTGPYPADYDGALFFADYARDCIWAMKRDGGALPSPSAVSAFVRAAANPVDVQVAPSGELFYADYNGGTIRRVTYVAGNLPPIAVATADRTEGADPAERGLRRLDLRRPRHGEPALVRLGPGRRRAARRLDGRSGRRSRTPRRGRTRRS